MKTFKLIAIAALTVTFAGAVAAQKKTTFTSRYTSMGATCKVQKGGDGQDDTKVCPGTAGYQIRISTSAAEMNILADKLGTDESYSVAVVGLEFNESKARLEWRLANGKPFAIIIRIPKYNGREDDVPGPGKIIGQELLVSGIGDYDYIYATVNARSANPNVKARAAADKAYKAN